MDYDISFSFVMPAYNTCKYISRSIESVLSQNYSNWELIVINDGSTDSTPQIIEEYSKKDSRIKYVSIPNSGVSHARNLGIELAKGDYIGFIDSDDWISSDMLSILVEHIYFKEPDIIQFLYTLVDIEKYTEKQVDLGYDKNISFVGNDNVVWAYFEGKISTSACNKMFKRAILSDLRFCEEMKIGEDDDFVYRYSRKIEKALLISNNLYYYLQTPNSAMRSVISEKDFQPMNTVEMQLLDYTDNETIRNLIIKRKVYLCIDLAMKIVKSEMMEEKLDEIGRQIKKYLWHIIKSDYLMKIKVASILLSINPNLFIKLFKILYV